MAGTTTGSECCTINCCGPLTNFAETAWKEFREGIITLKDGIKRSVVYEYPEKFFEYVKKATGSIEGWKKLSGIIIPLAALVLKKDVKSILDPLGTLAAQFETFKLLQGGMAWVAVGDDTFKKEWFTDRIIKNYNKEKYAAIAIDCIANVKRIGLIAVNCLKLISFADKLKIIAEVSLKIGSVPVNSLILTFTTLLSLIGNGLTFWTNYSEDKEVNDKIARFQDETLVTEDKTNVLRDRLRDLSHVEVKAEKETISLGSSNSEIDPSIIPFYEEKAGSFSGKQISQHLWLNPATLISDDMVQKVNQVAVYLAEQGFELRGIKADGNCFCNAFLKSYETLSRKIPILDSQENKIAYLREIIAARFQTTPKGIEKPDRAQEITIDGEWLTAVGEGDLLAEALDIPIRVITCNQDQEGCGISDMLAYQEKDKDAQDWSTIDESEKPKECILIVDLGGHFVCAQSLSLRKNGRLSESSCKDKIEDLKPIVKNQPINSEVNSEEELTSQEQSGETDEVEETSEVEEHNHEEDLSNQENPEYFGNFTYAELKQDIALKKAEKKLAKALKNLDEKREIVRLSNAAILEAREAGKAAEELKELEDERSALFSSCTKIAAECLACKANVDTLSTITGDEFKEYKIVQYHGRLADLKEQRTKTWIDVACNVVSLVGHCLGIGEAYYGIEAIMSYFDLEKESLINITLSVWSLLIGSCELGKFFYDEDHKEGRKQLSVAEFAALSAA